MEIKELQEKLEKAQAKIAKLNKTMERHFTQMEKKKAKVLSHGWNPYNAKCMLGTPEENEAFWAIIEFQNKFEDILNCENKIEEAERIAESWKEKLQKRQEEKQEAANEFPPALVEAQKYLAESWKETDIKAREFMIEKMNTLNHEEFRKLYTYSEQEELSKSNEEFERLEKKNAEFWTMNLFHRVKKVTGKITDCGHLEFKGKSLNGVVIGDEATVSVETIKAGGYNIQKLHYRVLLHKIEK